MISHTFLETNETLSKNITIQVDQNGLKFVVIKHEKCEAVFSLHGGQLIHFKSNQTEPLLYLSDKAFYQNNKAIRGGIPICWPWFGNTAHSISENLPAHGFARISQWTLSKFNETSEGVDIELSLCSDETTKSIWDFDFSLTLKASLTNRIELSLITENTGNKEFSYGGALHTYLHVSDIEQCSVEGLADQYLDSLDQRNSKLSSLPLTIKSNVDSIYSKNEGAVNIFDASYHREIKVSNNGNDTVVVWNPWVSGSKAFIDMPDDGYKNMLCIESAITQEMQRVKPGETHILSTLVECN